MKNFGAKLKELRIEKNMTQQQLAEQVHVTKQSVSKWEQGKSFPDIATVEMLAKFFETFVDVLINSGTQEKGAFENHEKNVKQNKVFIAITIVLSIVIASLSISIGIVARENYLLKNPKVTIIQDAEIKAINNYATENSVTFTLNFYNASDIKKTYRFADFSGFSNMTIYKPSDWSNNFSEFSIESKNSETIVISMYSFNGQTLKELGYKQITLYYLGQKIATIRIV